MYLVRVCVCVLYVCIICLKVCVVVLFVCVCVHMHTGHIHGEYVVCMSVRACVFVYVYIYARIYFYMYVSLIYTCLFV